MWRGAKLTPYRERRQKGYYNPKGETPQSTTARTLSGLTGTTTSSATTETTAKKATKKK